jgi:glutathione S-transferase
MPLDNLTPELGPELRDDELLITRTFDAPRALVFRLWSQAQHMQRWLGPQGFTCTHCEIDFRPGGKWLACIESEASGPLWMGGEFHEIEPDKRIAFSFGDRDPAANVHPSTEVVVTLTERGDGATLQTFHQTGFPTAAFRDGHVVGWNSAFEKAEAYARDLAGVATPVVFAFAWVPDFARGQVRDLRVRWALEEAGRPYRADLLESGDQGTPAYRRLQPFGQVPAYREGEVEIFESGAIVLHVGETSEALLPGDAGERARAKAWLLAALNSVETVVQPYAELDAFAAGEEWAKLRRPSLEQGVRRRLALLAETLGDDDYLEGRFTLGDLMMASVLGIIRGDRLLDEQPRLAAYLARCDARPAYQRALAAHLSDLRLER